MPLALAIVAGAGILLVVNVLRPRFGGAPPAPKPPAVIVPKAESVSAVTAPQAQQPPQQTQPQPQPQAQPKPQQPPQPQPQTKPQAPIASQPPAPDSSVAVEPTPPAAETVDTADAQRLYASTWMNVRAERSNKAPVVRVLRPGEVVLVDSPAQGWYRVVNDRQELGYVDRRLLDSTPPP